MTQVLHTTEKMLQLSLEKYIKGQILRKKRAKIWLVVMKKWQREHMGFNRQVEAREQVEQIRKGEKNN